MAMDFNALKKSRTNSLGKLLQESTKQTTTQSGSRDDDRFWSPEVDKAGNGYAVIRFLPEAKGEDLPWVRMFNHGFQGPGGWYIENSLTTIGKQDPVSEFNSELWNNGTDAGKEQARAQKRKLTYISNIYIVKDPAHPENEGKVMMFKYGKKIWDKINEAMNPQFEDEQPVNPFDFWEGADFKLKIRKVEGYRNYDKSEFDAPSALLGGDDEQLEAVYNSLHALQELIDPKNFKTYDELKAKLNRVLGLGGSKPVASKPFDGDDEEETTAPAPAAKQAAAPKQKAVVTEDEDDDMSFFAKLAEED